jgi:uncharacterized cupredoxin-like copper-binding protein
MSTSQTRPRSRTAFVALALASGALLVAGCGDDDDSSDPSSVAIEATGDKGAVEITAPSDADAGPAEITFTNNTDVEQDGQLAFVDEGEDRSDEEVLAELGKAVQGQPVADWFQAAGGPSTATKGESTTATVDLEAGTYYVLPSGENSAAPESLTKIEVTGESDDGLPEADGTVSAVEYSFSADGLKAGEQTLLLENNGGTWHHFLASKLKDGATIEQAKEFLTSEGGSGGPPPFVSEHGPVESTVIDGGKSQLVTANLEAGKYAFFCFVSDKQTGGPPHVVKGMVSEVEVSE